MENTGNNEQRHYTGNHYSVNDIDDIDNDIESFKNSTTKTNTTNKKRKRAVKEPTSFVRNIHETEIKSQKSKYFGFGGLKSKLKSKLAEITSYHMILNCRKIVNTSNCNNSININATDIKYISFESSQRDESNGTKFIVI